MFHSPRLTARSLCAEADFADIHALYVACADFVRLSQGAPPTEASTRAALAERAPGTTDADACLWGVSLRDAPDTLIGLIEGVYGYPKPDVWFLGLLMLHPDHRGRGLGAELIPNLLQHVAARGAASVQLAVLQRNPDARRFWTRLGFTHLRTRPILNDPTASLADVLARATSPSEASP